MSIKIVQVCDRCDRERDLKSVDEQQGSGWRELKPNKHICNQCVNEVLQK